MSKTIAVIRGDGIGPEIMNATLRVLDELKLGLAYDFVTYRRIPGTKASG